MKKAVFVAAVLLSATIRLPSALACPVPDGTPVRAVNMEGLRYTRAIVVERELQHGPGRLFSCADWLWEKRRLRVLGVFASSDMLVRMEADSAVLVYRFRELPPYIPLLSVMQTERDGLSLGPHLAAVNFLGTASKVHFLARFGGTTEYELSTSGKRPSGLPLEFEAAWVRVDSYNSFEGFHENSHQFRATGWWILTRRLALSSAGEFLLIRSDQEGITFRTHGDAVPRLGGGLRFDGRDRAVDPRRGVFAETRVTQSGGPLGGPANFREWLADGRSYLPLSNRTWLSAFILYRFREAGTLRRYDRLHAGGINTLRGFPKNARRGRSELLANFQNSWDLIRERVLTFPASGRWSVNYSLQAVAGLDAASLWDASHPMPSGFSYGWYAGLHLLFPGLERMRLEAGSSLVRLDFRLHLGLFERTTVQRFRTR